MVKSNSQPPILNPRARQGLNTGATTSSIVGIKKKLCNMAQRMHLYMTWGDRAEDDITKLPEEWEARVADDNRLYFVK